MNRLIFVIALYLLAHTPGTARADLIMTISAGSDNWVIIDNAPAGTTSSGGLFVSNVGDANSAADFVTFNGAGGAFGLLIGTGSSNKAANKLDLSTIGVNTLGSGDYQMTLIDTDFIAGSGGNYKLNSEVGGTTDGVVSNVFGGALDNNAEAGFPTITNQGPFQTVFSGSESGNTSLTSGLFSLSQSITVTHNGFSQVTSLDHEIQAVSVPEPASAMVIGSALVLGICLRNRRKRRTKTN